MTEPPLLIGQPGKSGGICCACGLPCQTIDPFLRALSKDMEKLRLVTEEAWLPVRRFFMRQFMPRKENDPHGQAE
jgi:hypothetical protein